MALDGVSAGNRLLAFGKVDPGTCLNAVWRAFGSPKSDGRYPYATATQALKRARELGAIKGYNINDAPEGSVLFWSNVWGYWKAAPGRTDAGHIAIKGPNNTVTTIDLPVRGRVGRVKPSAIWPHIRFEGYAYGPGAFMGLAVTPANSFTPLPQPASSNSKPIEEDDMYSDADRTRDEKVASQVAAIADTVQAIHSGVFTTEPTSRGNANGGVLASLREVDSKLNAVYDSQFSEKKTSRGTPGGTLHTLKLILEQLKTK